MEKTETGTLQEEPIVVLRQNHDLILMGLLFFGCFFCFMILGVIIPVLRTGTYSAVWGPADSLIRGENIILFYCAVIGTPLFSYLTIMSLRSYGDFFFYSDRLEFKSFWFKRQGCIPYNKMYVVIYETYISVSTEKMPTWKFPLKYLKAQFNAFSFPTIFSEPKILGMTEGLLSKRWKNPEDGPQALQILQEKALSVAFR